MANSSIGPNTSLNNPLFLLFVLKKVINRFCAWIPEMTFNCVFIGSACKLVTSQIPQQIFLLSIFQEIFHLSGD